MGASSLPHSLPVWFEASHYRRTANHRRRHRQHLADNTPGYIKFCRRFHGATLAEGYFARTAAAGPAAAPLLRYQRTTPRLLFPDALPRRAGRRAANSLACLTSVRCHTCSSLIQGRRCHAAKPRFTYRCCLLLFLLYFLFLLS